MDRLERDTLLSRLIQSLREHGSWGGETHVQKAAYLLQELLGVELGVEFVLYKHGPFSFDLRDELTAMRADGLVDQVPAPPYGPQLDPTPISLSLVKRATGTARANFEAVDFVATQLGDKGIFQLEQLTTAVYVWLRGTREQNAMVEKIVELKPHVSEDAAGLAVRDMQHLRAEAIKANLLPEGR